MALEDCESVLDKLLEKSAQGRIPWEPIADKHFRCTLEGYKFDVSKYEDAYRITMSDAQGFDIFHVSVQDEVFFSDPARENIFRKLSDLFEKARRKALDVDRKLVDVSGLLDRI